jgi:hypothetical protein
MRRYQGYNAIQMRRRRLSTIMTFPAMFAGPLLVTIAGVLALYYYVLRDSREASNIPVLIFLCGFIGVLLWGNFIWHRSRRVLMDEANFYFSNYLLNEITVPISDVVVVTERIYARNNFVELHLRQPTKLGQIIRFMPRMRVGSKFAHSDPVVAELRELIASRVA